MTMKLLSLAVGAAAAATSTATASSIIQSSSSIPLVGGNGVTTHRTLQNAGSSYSFLDSLSGYSLQYSSCLRVKIPQENDDDAVDGNVNFYNGAYRAQYSVMALFHVCGDGDYNNNGNNDQCYDGCDYGVEYAMGVDEFLEVTLDHWGNYCDSCQDACGDGRRRLDEDQEEEQMDCSTCSNSCMNFNQGGDDNADETGYMECQAGVEDDDGLQLYYGPQCSDDGRIVIGVFYDDECTIKTKDDYPAFNYYKFTTVTSACVDCSSNDGQETCEELYNDAYHCQNGKDQQGQDDAMSVCSAVKKSLTVIDYGGVKKRHAGKDAFLKVFVGLLLVGGIGGFMFLAYTYYIRHSGEKGEPMLSSDDMHHDGEDHQAPPGATLT